MRKYHLLAAAHQFLSEDSLRDLVERFWTARETEPGDQYQTEHWTRGIELLAQQLCDAPLFEKARLAAWPEQSAATCQDIARAHLEAGDATAALSWMRRVPDGDTFRADKGDRLLLKIYGQLGNNDGMADSVWRIFHRLRSKDALATLLAVIGEDKRDQVIAGEVQGSAAESPWTQGEFLVKISDLKTRQAGLALPR